MSGVDAWPESRLLELAPEFRALAGSEEDVGSLLEALHRVSPGLVLRLRAETVREYPIVSLEEADAARALRRALLSAAERSQAQGAPAAFAACEAALVLADLGLVQAALLGQAPAWNQLREFVTRAIAMLAARTGQGKRGQAIVQELKDDLLGSFILQEKLLTYRATAPLVPWIRQIAFNRFRERLLEMKRRSTAEPLFSDLNQDSETPLLNLLPGTEGDALSTIAALEWEAALRHAVPEVLAALPTTERRMMEVLPSKVLTQVQLCQELGVSAFTLNRWYKEARQRFLRLLVQDLRFRLGLLDVPTQEILRWLEEGPGS